MAGALYSGTFSINELFPVIFTNKRDRILSFYSVEDIKKVTTTVNRNTLLGKPDLAILVLAAELGMHSGDICRLKIEDIHWERNTVELTNIRPKYLINCHYLKISSMLLSII